MSSADESSPESENDATYEPSPEIESDSEVMRKPVCDFNTPLTDTPAMYGQRMKENVEEAIEDIEEEKKSKKKKKKKAVPKSASKSKRAQKKRTKKAGTPKGKSGKQKQTPKSRARPKTTKGRSKAIKHEAVQRQSDAVAKWQAFEFPEWVRDADLAIHDLVRQENTIDSVGVYQRCVGMAVASRVLREVDIRDAWNFTETPRNHKAYRRDMRKFDKKWFQSKITRNKLTYIVKKAGGFPENVTIGRSFYAGLFEERVTYAKSWSRNQVIRAKFRKEAEKDRRYVFGFKVADRFMAFAKEFDELEKAKKAKAEDVNPWRSSEEENSDAEDVVLHKRARVKKAKAAAKVARKKREPRGSDSSLNELLTQSDDDEADAKEKDPALDTANSVDDSADNVSSDDDRDDDDGDAPDSRGDVQDDDGDVVMTIADEEGEGLGESPDGSTVAAPTTLSAATTPREAARSFLATATVTGSKRKRELAKKLSAEGDLSSPLRKRVRLDYDIVKEEPAKDEPVEAEPTKKQVKKEVKEEHVKTEEFDVKITGIGVSGKEIKMEKLNFDFGVQLTDLFRDEDTEMKSPPSSGNKRQILDVNRLVDLTRDRADMDIIAPTIADLGDDAGDAAPKKDKVPMEDKSQVDDSTSVAVAVAPATEEKDPAAEVVQRVEVNDAVQARDFDSDKFRNASTAAQAQVQKDLKKRKRKGKKGKNKAVETGFEDRDDVHIEVKRSSSDGPSIHPWLYLFDDRQPLPSSEFSRNKVGRRKVDHAAAQRPQISTDPNYPIDILTVNVNQKVYYVMVAGNRMTFDGGDESLFITDDGTVRARVSRPINALSIPVWVFDRVDANEVNIQLYGDEDKYVTETRSTSGTNPKPKMIGIRAPCGVNVKHYSRLLAGEVCIALVGRYHDPSSKMLSKTRITKIGGSGVYSYVKTTKGGFANQHVIASPGFKAFRSSVDPQNEHSDEFLMQKYLNLGEFMRQNFMFVHCPIVLRIQRCLLFSKQGRQMVSTDNEAAPVPANPPTEASKYDVMLENMKKLFDLIGDRAVTPDEVKTLFNEILDGAYWDDKSFVSVMSRMIKDKVVVKFGRGKTRIYTNADAGSKLMSYVKERVYKESEIARAYNARDPAVSTIVATLMNSTRLKIEGKLKDRACGIMLKDLKKSFKMNVDNVVADNPEVESISSDYGELLMAKEHYDELLRGLVAKELVPPMVFTIPFLKNALVFSLKLPRSTTIEKGLEKFLDKIGQIGNDDDRKDKESDGDGGNEETGSENKNENENENENEKEKEKENPSESQSDDDMAVDAAEWFDFTGKTANHPDFQKKTKKNLVNRLDKFVLELVQPHAETQKWIDATSSATPGNWVTRDDEEAIMNADFVGEDLFVQFRGCWFPCKCIYGERDFVYFVGTDVLGFGMRKSDIRDAVDNKRMKFLGTK